MYGKINCDNDEGFSPPLKCIIGSSESQRENHYRTMAYVIIFVFKAKRKVACAIFFTETE
jgi:hypothetical protein